MAHTNTTREHTYKDTLNLPRTDFPIRAQSDVFDPQLLKRWDTENLDEKTFSAHQGNKTFILHDGPPYANGSIHLGHAYNKILKDIVCKFERMTGKHVPFTPGWDCHGLPIELSVSKAHPGIEKSELQKKCREYAQKWVKVQTQEFKELGIFADFDRPYLTMNHGYEAAIVRAFGKFVASGYIEKKLKTVPWCGSCQTVLATAEIEYEDRKDPSIYVQFPFSQQVAQQLFPDVDAQISLLIWTTTPWTLPLNRAVVVKPGACYQLVKLRDTYIILGKELVAGLASLVGQEPDVIAEFAAEKILGQQVQHPFVPNLQVPVIGDPFVSLEDGTACVHSAPGCGPEDYELGRKNNLEIYSPIAQDATYTSEIVPGELAGMPVADGQIWVIKKLAQTGMLFFKKSIRHSYPHCWRCHKGLIFRATSQWFCDLSRNNLKQRALQAIDSMQMLPHTAKNRLQATVEGRLEWCLSRQRAWGVPIPALVCADSDFVYTSPEFIETIAQGIQKHGVEYWNDVAIADIMPADLQCPKTGSTHFVKEQDILDVWFDSGVSHYAVLQGRSDLRYPADLYVEGKDQHRGWFQSSLLTSLVLEDEACTQGIMTHGFTVDKDGKKMSKSRGNVVTPQELIKKMGTDGLRLWVASNDIASDPVVSDMLVKNVGQVYRKIRNTCRFLLSNLYDFDASNDAVAYDDLMEVDKFGLYQLRVLERHIMQAYQDRKITAVFHELADYCVKDLSSLYLDVIKDRLYTEQPDGRLRRSAQTVCHAILDTVSRLMAPILSFTAELVTDHSQKDKQASIHLQTFADLGDLDTLFAGEQYRKAGLPANISDLLRDVDYNTGKRLFAPFHALHVDRDKAAISAWTYVLDIRDIVLKQLEQLRSQGTVKHSLDAVATITLGTNYEGVDLVNNLMQCVESSGESVAHFWSELCIVSRVDFTILDKAIDNGLFVQCSRSSGDKCQRCWQLTQLQGDVCKRCYDVLQSGQAQTV